MDHAPPAGDHSAAIQALVFVACWKAIVPVSPVCLQCTLHVHCKHDVHTVLGVNLHVKHENSFSSGRGVAC